MGQIQALLASMKKNNEEQHLAESNTVDPGRERDFDVVSVSASDSYFDEHLVMTETVVSPESLCSSSALSSGHDGEPVSVANSRWLWQNSTLMLHLVQLIRLLTCFAILLVRLMS